jgi:hypothetical protein
MPQTYERKTFDLFISDNLRQLLEPFKEESQVADLLLHKRLSKDLIVDNPINFISISDSDRTKISYLTDDRMKKVADSDTDDYWTTSSRFHCKAGAFISKLFKDISSKEVEKFANLYKTIVNKKEFTFEIVKGDDIRKYYHYDFHESNSGSLGNSCMRYDRCQKFFDLYVDNNVASMLLIKNPDGKLIGRAILWDFDGNKVMDRIYTVQDDEYQHFFKKWAKDNGYLFKTKQNWNNTIKFDSKTSENVDYEFGIQLKKWRYSYYPYLDTFKWIDVKTGVLTNYKPVDCSNVYVISNADGRTDSHTYLDFDSIGRDWHYAGSLVYVEEHGIMTNSDNLHYSETLSKWVLRTEAVYSDELRDFIYKDDSLNDQDLINERKDFIEKSRIYNQIRIEELSKKISDMDLQELLSISDYFGRR